MKKTISKVLCLILTITFICFGSVVLAQEKSQVKVLNATYEVVSNVKTVDLGYGITHTKDISKSTKLADGELLPQSVNVLEVPSKEDVRVVSWTLSNSSGWSKATVRAMANDFENKNPGWVVVAAVNGDFFDIDGKDKRLPYQTGGVTVSEGETYRPFTNAQSIGFKNDGSAYPFVADKKFEVSNHYLNIYDETGNVIYEKEVKYLNETPEDGEVAIWYTYRDSKGVNQLMTLPSENTYYVKSPVRLLPMSTENVYAKGMISGVNQGCQLYYGQFGIETTNEEIRALLSEGTMIRIQQNVVGDYAECTDITGGGVTLVKNGEAVDNTSNMDTHPRTCVGVKEDGTIVFMTVDGRQEENDMCGMAYNELSATMLYYGCYEAYNLDGGGSTTFLTRNQFGDFNVENSPSDGGERHDSNSLLIVVPEISLEVTNVSDTEVVIDYKAPKDRNIEVSEINVTLNGETRTISEYPYTWTGLTKLSTYNINAKYNITYKNISKEKEIFPIQITTGYERPVLENSYYFVYENKVYINYSILNPDKIKVYADLVTGKKFDQLTKEKGFLTYKLGDVNIDKITIKLGYDLTSSHSGYEEIDILLEQKTIEELTRKITLNLNGGKLDKNELTYIEGIGLDVLPTPKKTLSKFIGWKYNGEIITKIPNTFSEDIVLEAVYEKGCGKTSAEMLITTLSAISLALLVLRKNKD